MLADQLARTGVKPEMIEFVGDDESGFIEAGIPVGGAQNGDSKKKTALVLDVGDDARNRAIIDRQTPWCQR
ncbi:hypothetical protein BKA01_006568 [Pseudonocardia eucalypti]|uniref:hypothetical protein n=1 Tax=Pseudonocardia eucalypti TaxID=648755 RepID=UPI0016075B99|nr:hypothetical protein [Pseudonocardia eucalypti]